MESHFQQQIHTALADKKTLYLTGGQTKHFYGHAVDATHLSTLEHTGITCYEPSELVMTAKSGTPLAVIQQTLSEHQQMLAFEPPAFGEAATLGGTIACGLAGPRRPHGGAVRDSVLGIKMINGSGEILNFGGQVMKNVAGYDLSRLMTGSLGTLGLILEVSLKVLPVPQREATFYKTMPIEAALAEMSRIARRCPELSATAFYNDTLYLRLSGTAAGVEAAAKQLDAEPLDQADSFWQSIKEQQHEFFSQDQPLWRISVPSDTPPLPLDGAPLIEWGGALRWHLSSQSADSIRSIVEQKSGHATLFNHFNNSYLSPVFHPLQAHSLQLHQRVKQAFDPHGIFNLGRMYPTL